MFGFVCAKCAADDRHRAIEVLTEDAIVEEDRTSRDFD
jgi:hypothetical protein